MNKYYELRNEEKIPKNLVEGLKDTEGLICSIVYGSFARGEKTPSSDLDIMNIFEDRGSIEREDDGLRDLKMDVEFDHRIQFLNEDLENMMGSEGRDVITSALHEGEILFLKRPLGIPASILPPKQNFQIISYDTSTLDNKSISKIHYQLYGKKDRHKGIVGKSNTVWKISNSTILADRENAKKIKDKLEKFGGSYKEWDVWL